MKKEKIENRKVSEITKDLISDELQKKIDAISEKSLTDKTVLNRSIWKPIILQSYKTEKTARRILRNEQMKLSILVCKSAKIKDNANLQINSANLEIFYKTNLINREKFSNKDADKKDNNLVYLASEISLNLTK